MIYSVDHIGQNKSQSLKVLSHSANVTRKRSSASGRLP